MSSRVAVVTGGAQGIGRGIVKYLLRDGASEWNIVVVDRSREGVDDAIGHFAMSFPGVDVSRRVKFVTGDCAVPATAFEAVNIATESFGRIDLLVNNAGGGGIGTPFAEQTVDTFLATINANLTAAYAFSHAAQGALIANGGSIVHIASTRAFMSEPHSEPYAAAKGGIVALTHALAASLAPEVNVNCVCPGWIDVSGPEWGPGRSQLVIKQEDKDQHWTGRVGTPDDVAQAVLFFANAKFVTGQSLCVDGGMTKKMIYVD
jgi:NAD(P)-dependent dehydrogenase (short-subunit alcohol dehydrogenase family)